MSLPRLPFLLLGGALALTACGDDAPSSPDAGDDHDAADHDAAPPIEIPAFRNEVTMDDLELAYAAADRLGVGERKACDSCHALTRDRLRSWDLETDAADDQCLADGNPETEAEARAILDCFRDSGTDRWAPERLGIYTTGAAHGWFEAVFALAYGRDSQEWEDWTERMAMPQGAQTPLTAGEFDVVAEWFARGLPELETVVPDAPPPGDCEPSITADVAAHVTAMETQGWAALNQDANLNMFGCQGASSPAGCLTTFPGSSSQAYSDGWTAPVPDTTIRLLYTTNYASAYWTRSSADGRFVAHGGAAGGGFGGSTVVDLADARAIPANASYDPGFFPDNSGFVIQGGGWCRQSLLTSEPAQITFAEPECSSVNEVQLYQHLGAASGGDYWAVHGHFVSDNGGGEPAAYFSQDSENTLTPMIWTGTAYQARNQITVDAPFEGDTVMSPSARLLISRVAGEDSRQNGFVMRKLVATPSDTGYDVATPEIGRYCVNGGKPAFSYDERWLTYHHWVQPGDWQAMGYSSENDPDFLARVNTPTANVWLLDLVTGETRRITDAEPGQEILFPHFRSDGWIYFIVKGATGGEVIAASDAALVLGS